MNTNKKIIISLVVLIIAAVSIWFFYFKNQVKEVESKCLHGQTEIYEQYKDAVVLVKHTYNIKFKIKDSEPFSIDVDAYGLQEQTVFGTGFFVSDEGKIATNDHVAKPWAYDENNTNQWTKEYIASILPDSVATNDIKQYLEQNWTKYMDEGYEEEEYQDGEDVQNVDENDTLSDYAEGPAVAAVPEFEKVSINDIEIVPETVEISIALHGSSEDWIDCKVINTSDDKDVDVALIQTKNEMLPTTVKNIINLNDAIVDDTTLKPGNKAVLIGYPMGMTLASTRKGIMVQSYEGQINKESDGVSIQYNITSTHGASGSPVFNDCGQLIAINYAGYDQAQGYNFGIVAKYVQKMAE